MDDWIQLFDGSQLFFMKGPLVIADSVTAEQIGHGLSMLCRYAGQCDGFYTVAEHSALMAEAIWAETKDERLSLGCLFHDATEAFLPDIPRPLKVHLPDYYDMEARLMEGISLKFELQDMLWTVIANPYQFPEGAKDHEYQRKVQMHPKIGEYDNRILVDEKAAIMTRGDHVWATDELKPLGVKIRCLSPADAKRYWMQTYEVFNR